ncbi:MAG: hypothetical protein KJO07_01840 [Deltaproteobacteria bacterium]|nr:hypothetical protein [Deltaproteobacteria bacterium]
MAPRPRTIAAALGLVGGAATLAIISTLQIDGVHDFGVVWSWEGDRVPAAVRLGWQRASFDLIEGNTPMKPPLWTLAAIIAVLSAWMLALERLRLSRPDAPAAESLGWTRLVGWLGWLFFLIDFGRAGLPFGLAVVALLGGWLAVRPAHKAVGFRQRFRRTYRVVLFLSSVMALAISLQFPDPNSGAVATAIACAGLACCGTLTWILQRGAYGRLLRRQIAEVEKMIGDGAVVRFGDEDQERIELVRADGTKMTALAALFEGCARSDRAIIRGFKFEPRAPRTQSDYRSGGAVDTLVSVEHIDLIPGTTPRRLHAFRDTALVVIAAAATAVALYQGAVRTILVPFDPGELRAQVEAARGLSLEQDECLVRMSSTTSYARNCYVAVVCGNRTLYRGDAVCREREGRSAPSDLTNHDGTPLLIPSTDGKTLIVDSRYPAATVHALGSPPYAWVRLRLERPED